MGCVRFRFHSQFDFEGPNPGMLVSESFENIEASIIQSCPVKGTWTHGF